MQQQMYQGMEGGNTPIQAPPPVRPTPVPFRGRGQGMGMRGRGGGFQRGRGEIQSSTSQTISYLK